MANKNTGVIYVLTNPSFPEYVKIGYASNLERRLSQLNRSETIPYVFRVYAIYEVHSKLTDKELHRLIDSLNPDLRSVETFDGKVRTKEFFQMTPEEAYELLKSIARISGTEDRLHLMTPEGHEIVDEKNANEVREESVKERKAPFDFIKFGIPTGSTLEFIEDPSIKVTVIDSRHIEYDGITTSVSRLAQDLKKTNHPLQGTLFFSFNGKRLVDIRDEYLES